MDRLLWLLVPERPLSELYVLAGRLQDKAEKLIKYVEDKKTTAVDSLYYEVHEGEDV